MAGPVGFEPAIEGSEPSALPLGYGPNKYGRDIRIRTRTNGFGDRCATVDTISLNGKYKYSIISQVNAIQTKKKMENNSIFKMICVSYTSQQLKHALI